MVEGELDLVIDLERCEFIDSTGVAAIVQANRDRAAADGGVLVHSAGAQVLRVLTITGLADHGLVFPDSEATLASLGEEESAQQVRQPRGSQVHPESAPGEV